MSEGHNIPNLHGLAAAEIFRSLRLELIPRRRRTVPPVLFLHRRDPDSGELSVESVQLTNQPRDAWALTIARRVAESGAQWWAVSVELCLKVSEADISEDDENDDDIPDESRWLVVMVASRTEQEIWWGMLERDEDGQLVAVSPEEPMPAGNVRDEVLKLLGDGLIPLDA